MCLPDSTRLFYLRSFGTYYRSRWCRLVSTLVYLGPVFQVYGLGFRAADSESLHKVLPQATGIPLIKVTWGAVCSV